MAQEEISFRARMVSLARQLASMMRSFWNTLLYAIRNYLWSKTTFVPSPLPKGRGAILSAIFEREKFQEFIHQFSAENGIALDHVEGTVRRYFKEIAADMNYLTIPFWDIGLTWLFNTLFEGLEVDSKALEKIRHSVGQCPIVFVPNHRSHTDYLILSYVFYHHRIPLPHICAGKNLAFWPFGPIGRKAGAFFIRRSYEGNRLYAACVQFYLEELVREKATIQFFIEGGRSRTGKLLSPKMGILSSLVQAYLNGATDEIMIVPTSLTYESVPEEKNYVAEQVGGVKRDESFWDLLRLRKYLKKNPGKVSVQFGDPISVKEFMDEKIDKRTVVQKIASETTYGINKSALATPFSLVAMALLTATGRSIRRDQVDTRLNLYLDYLKFKDCRISESLIKSRGKSVDQALAVFIKERLIQAVEDDDGGMLYSVREERRPLLDYYKNNSLHFFVSLAVVTTLIESAPTKVLPVSRLEESFRFIQDLFAHEFTFSRRQPVPAHLKKLLGYLEKKELVTVGPDEVALTSGSEKNLAAFSSLTKNFFESYRIVWESLPTLGSRRWEQRELVRWLQRRGQLLYLKERVDHVESWNRFPLQNALLAFRDLGILSEERSAWGRRRKTTLKVTIGDHTRLFTPISHLWKTSPRILPLN